MEAYSFNGVLASRKFIYRLLEYHLIGFSIIDASIIEITRGELNHGGSGCAIFIQFEHVLGISFIRAIYRKWKYTCFVHEKNVFSCNAHDSWTHTNFHTNCFSFVVEVQHCTKVLVYLTNFLWKKKSVLNAWKSQERCMTSIFVVWTDTHKLNIFWGIIQFWLNAEAISIENRMKLHSVLI